MAGGLCPAQFGLHRDPRAGEDLCLLFAAGTTLHPCHILSSIPGVFSPELNLIVIFKAKNVTSFFLSASLPPCRLGHGL